MKGLKIMTVSVYMDRERPIGHANFICPSTGERQGQKGEWAGRGVGVGGYGGLLV
jgi:hypothetical protein